MKQYTDILREILRRGRRKVNRTGVETLSIIGPSMTFYMDDGFPLETLRPIFFKGIKEENLWFIDGRCNNEALLAKGVQIWNSWALPEAITQNAFRALPDVVADYVAYRQKLLAESEAKLVVESGDASVISEQPAYTFEDAVRELTLADQKAMDEGKPVVGKPLGAQTHEELMGGHEILRNAGIPMTEEQVLMPKGYLGPIYGVLWRGWIDHTGRRIDQLANVLAKLASDNPKLRYSRSNIITSYNPAVLPDETKSAQENILDGKQALAACHTMFQLLAEPMTLEERVAWHNRKVDEARDIHGDQVGADFEQVRWNYVSVESLWTLSSIPAQDFDEEAGHGVMDKLDCPRDQLSLVLYQRSADFPVGVPFNIAGYALLLHMFAAQLNMKPYQFTHHFGDAHIYVDQIDGVKELLERDDACKEGYPPLPKLWLNPEVKSIVEYTSEDIRIDEYAPVLPQIKFPVAV